MATVTNFGRNLHFQPQAVISPRTPAELLEILRTHRGKRLLAVGQLHSWSAAPVGEEIVVRLEHFTRVDVHEEAEASWAEVEAGCTVKQVLEVLGQRGYTLPSVGLITAQSLVGAASTGTHGSGRSSLSHYVQAVRIARYDPATGEPQVSLIDAGDELLAARCSLGCLGIITSIRVPIRRQYRIEEFIWRYHSLEEVLQQENEYPLQQFFLIPWRWDFFAQQRRESNQPRSTLAWHYRLFWRIGMDVWFHYIVLLLVRVLPSVCTKFFYRWLLPLLIPQGWNVVDRSDRQLTMQHQLFRHIEIEVFVRRSQLQDAIEYVVWLLKHLSGMQAEPPALVHNRLQNSADWPQLLESRGVYVHHYAICVRKVLPDDALISMTSGMNEASYALSFISYHHPQRRDGFFRFAQILAATMASLFDARPHWGKYCPLAPEELARLYPQLPQFAQLCDANASRDVFVNHWLQDVLAKVPETSSK